MNTTRVLLCGVLSLIGIGMSVGAFLFGGPDGPVFYWGILPGAPVLLVAGLASVSRVPVRMTVGASIGCLLAIAASYGPLLYSSANYSGGGANIGAGLLILASPVLLAIAIVIGGVAGWCTGKRG